MGQDVSYFGRTVRRRRSVIQNGANEFFNILRFVQLSDSGSQFICYVSRCNVPNLMERGYIIDTYEPWHLPPYFPSAPLYRSFLNNPRAKVR